MKYEMFRNAFPKIKIKKMRTFIILCHSEKQTPKTKPILQRASGQKQKCLQQWLWISLKLYHKRCFSMMSLSSTISWGGRDPICLEFYALPVGDSHCADPVPNKSPIKCGLERDTLGWGSTSEMSRIAHHPQWLSRPLHGLCSYSMQSHIVL